MMAGGRCERAMIRCGAEVCHNLELALRREWLETNGLGGFASSTILGLNTRRYHGLLVAAAKPPVDRQVLLAKLEETLVVDGRRFDLSANQYPDVVHPQGYRFMKEFRLDPFPVFVYEVDGVNLEKSVFMVHGENTTIVQYRIQGKAACLEVRPLIAARDHHELKRRNDNLNGRFQSEAGWVMVKPYDGLLSLHIAHNASEIQPAGCWFSNLRYDRERERGLGYEEDLFNPFVLKFSGSGTMISSTEPHEVVQANSLRQIEVERRKQVVDESPSDDEFVRDLVGAADQFLVARGAYGTVIAGYPWFSDWGRDTMIALPGLTLATGRISAAQNILQSFVHHINRGIIPNRFPDNGAAPEYETADATLWLFEAIRAFLAYTQDYEFVLTYLYDALVDVISWHERGTRHGIRVDAIDGLLYAGERGAQLYLDGR